MFNIFKKKEESLQDLNVGEINPECERCGACCNTYSFWTGRKASEDPKEIIRLIQYHGCNAVKHPERDELGIEIPITCEHLEFKDDKAICKIYKTRPLVCKEYFCRKVIKKAIMKKTEELVKKNGFFI